MSEDKAQQNQSANKTPSEVVRKVIDKLTTDEVELDTLPLEGLVQEQVIVDALSSIAPPASPADATVVNREAAAKLSPEPARSSADIESKSDKPEEASHTPPPSAPWALQQFFSGEIELDQELSKRLPHMPMLTTIQFRTLGTQTTRHVATLGTQDAAASLIVDVDVPTKAVSFSFTFGSMLTLRFLLNALSVADRTRWLELMRRDEGGLSFLWNSQRWAKDYVICVTRKHHTNFYAFSPHQFEAGVRITPPIMKQLLDWLEPLWLQESNAPKEEPPLLTW